MNGWPFLTWLLDCACTTSSQVLTSSVYELEVWVMLRVCQQLSLPDRFHELICKITMSQEKVILQGPEMVKQSKLVKEYVE